LIGFLAPSDPNGNLTQVQSLSLATLATLARNPVNRDDIRKHDGLPLFLRLLALKDQKNKIEDLKALKECSKNATNQSVLRDGKLLEALIPMILPDNEPVQMPALDTLFIMTLNNPLSQASIREANGVQPIIDLLKHNSAEIRKRAARTLGAVAGNNRKIQQQVRRAKAIQRVIQMLSDENEEVRKAAAGGLGFIAENDRKLFLLTFSLTHSHNHPPPQPHTNFPLC
jgi:hypothetical protein